MVKKTDHFRNKSHLAHLKYFAKVVACGQTPPRLPSTATFLQLHFIICCLLRGDRIVARHEAQSNLATLNQRHAPRRTPPWAATRRQNAGQSRLLPAISPPPSSKYVSTLPPPSAQHKCCSLKGQGDGSAPSLEGWEADGAALRPRLAIAPPVCPPIGA